MLFSELNAGDHARVIGFAAENKAYRQKLMAMGLTKGALFSVLRQAPLGDPFHITVRGTSLSLRKYEANILQVERI